MNPWKLATFGIVTVLVASLGTGLTTAYFMRPAAADAVTPAAAPARVQYAVATPSAAPRAVVPPAVRPVAYRTAAASGDCATTSDRMWRIAKPGLIGTVLGAGAGAAGGAIANGGKAAGKGAIIGGLAGAALGSAYGAYKTKNECGTVFGGTGSGFTAPSGNGDRVMALTPSAPAAPASAGDRIQVFDAGRSLPR
jgi:hypothetical protein